MPGATSFDDLKTVDGAVSGSFREVCIQERFLSDDTENDNALTEASGFQIQFLNSYEAYSTLSVRIINLHTPCACRIITNTLPCNKVEPLPLLGSRKSTTDKYVPVIRRLSSTLTGNDNKDYTESVSLKKQ